MIWQKIFSECFESADSFIFSFIFIEIICGLLISRLCFQIGLVEIFYFSSIKNGRHYHTTGVIAILLDVNNLDESNILVFKEFQHG